MSDADRVEAGEHQDAGDGAHDARERVDQDQRALGVEAGIGGCADVGADHADGKPVPGVGEEDVPEDGTGEEQQERNWDPKQGAVADGGHPGRKTRDVAALGQELSQAAQEDHHGKGHKDRMRADIGDDGAHDRAGQGAHADGKDGADEEGHDPGIHPAVLVQDESQRQPGHVGGVDDRQVEPARDDRHQHGQCQQAKLGQLEGDGAEVGSGQEVRREKTEDHKDKRKKAEQAWNLGTEGGGEAAVEVAHAGPPFRGPNHRAGSKLEVEIARRMMMPTTILKA